MSLQWTDSIEIALDLMEEHPDVDPKRINFVDLRRWVLELEQFNDNPDRCGERILEAIQMAWLEEYDE
ncbi:MAG: Fe-S cluster assembly protein IscX [Gammaproteobacteria bacterium]|nr:Fe-S cluster assembly protein IscX [Gammaproteobacteria bacterium]